MQPHHVFALQSALSLAAWSHVAWLLWPALARRPRDEALALVLAPQSFRHVGATMLVPAVAGAGLPPEWTVPLAVGDVATSALALCACAALRLRARVGRGLAWAATAFGLLDLLHNVVAGARLGVASRLAATWFVPAFLVPAMLVAHALALRTLLRRDE